MRTSLFNLFTKGVLWSGGSSVVTSVVRLLIIFVLARLLAPNDFGLFSLTLLVIEFGNDIGDLGTGPAIIQRQHINQRLLSTIFWTVMLGGAVLFIIGIILSPLFAWFFHESKLIKLIIISSISFIIRSAGFVHRALLQKKMLFKKIAIVEIGSTLVFGLVSIILAIQGNGVWSLIYGLLAHRLADVIIVWRVSRFRPSLEYDFSESLQVFHFAKNITGERITYFFSSRMDYIIIGRILGPSLLGYYTLANEIINLLIKRISAIFSTVSFPTFSILQDQIDRLKNAYIRVNKTLSLITFPLLGGLMALASESVRTFYGAGWEPVIVPLQVLCIVGAIKSIMYNNGTIFYTRKRPELAFKWGLIQMITIPIPLLIGSIYGLTGIALSLTITFVVYFIYIQNVINSLIELKFIKYMRIFLPSIVATIFMTVVIVVYKSSITMIYPINDTFVLLVGCIVASISYLLFLKLFVQGSWLEMKDIAKKILTIRA